MSGSPPRYDLVSLNVFRVVAQERNVTRAARLCHLAVSAVSKRISELEDQVGVPLFIRHARGMGLTPAGETMLHYVERVHGDLRLMQLELNEHGSGATGHIRLQAITSALTNHLTPDLASFMGLYPRVDFDIEERWVAASSRQWRKAARMWASSPPIPPPWTWKPSPIAASDWW